MYVKGQGGGACCGIVGRCKRTCVPGGTKPERFTIDRSSGWSTGRRWHVLCDECALSPFACPFRSLGVFGVWQFAAHSCSALDLLTLPAEPGAPKAWRGGMRMLWAAGHSKTDSFFIICACCPQLDFGNIINYPTRTWRGSMAKWCTPCGKMRKPTVQYYN